MSQTVISLLAIGVYIPACLKKPCQKPHTVKCLDIVNVYEKKIYKFKCECHPPYGGLYCEKSE